MSYRKYLSGSQSQKSKLTEERRESEDAAQKVLGLRLGFCIMNI